MRNVLLLLAILVLTSCSSSLKLKQQLNETTLELAQAKRDLIELGHRSDNMLIHTVYFKLKPDLSDQQHEAFLQEIAKLHQIKQVKGLIYGSFAELGDSRAMLEFQLAMQMGFESEKAYREYQAHAIHLALKEAAKSYLAGPPVTHDFWTETKRN